MPLQRASVNHSIRADTVTAPIELDNNGVTLIVYVAASRYCPRILTSINGCMDFGEHGDQYRNAADRGLPRMSVNAAVGTSADQLTDEAIRLLLKLACRVSVQEIAIQFPRVLNRVAGVWTRAADAAACFEELLSRTPGIQPEFPPSVVGQLVSLQCFHATQVLCGDIRKWTK